MSDEVLSRDLARHAGSKSHEALKDALLLARDSAEDITAASSQIAMSFAAQAVAAAAGVVLANANPTQKPDEESITNAQVAVMAVLLSWLGPYQVASSPDATDKEP